MKNRKREFRVWDGKAMSPCFLIDSFTGCAMVDVSGATTVLEKRPDWIVMDWTGLRDKNHKKIYEGDVIKISEGHKDWINKEYEVFFKDGAFQMRVPNNNPVSFAYYFHCATNNGVHTESAEDRYKLFEVMGNIYENPELL